MSRFGACALLVLTSVLGLCGAAQAQPPGSATPASNAGGLKVFLTCKACDVDHLADTLRFIELVRDPYSAQVDVAASTVESGTETRWTLRLIGAGSHKGQNRTVTFATAAGASPEQNRADVSHFLALALAPYAATAAVGPHMDVTFTRPGAAEPAAARKDQHDIWNYWVYRFGANFYQSGEQATWSSSYGLNGSANRTTENWKIRLSVSRSLSESEFEVEDDIITSRLSDWSVDALIVKSLGPNWSWAIISSVTGSTFSNAEMVRRFTPGIEYDIFPYADSTRRSLTLQYTAGYAHYQYHELTIYGVLEEEVAQHAFNASLGLRQPWGSTGASVIFTQQLTAPDRTRLSASGSFNVRLTGSLSLNGNASYSRIRDLFTLPRGIATDEEVLLRVRQLYTGYRYSFNLGFLYAFGALSNTTVNPRFGG